LAAGGLIGALTHQNLIAELDDASHDHTWIQIVRRAAVLAEISLTTTCCDQASVDGAPAMTTIFHSLPPARSDVAMGALKQRNDAANALLPNVMPITFVCADETDA
jgi:hypothetical protein